MNSFNPQIDRRDQDAIASQVRDHLVEFLPDNWAGSTADEQSAAIKEDPQTETLVQIFARAMESVNQRINRIPDKHFLSFLEMLGVDQLPPESASAYLLLETTPQAESPVLVPEGTQVSPVGGGENPVVFETTEDISVLPWSIQKSFVHSPNSDRFTDSSALLTKESSTTIFSGQKKLPHRIYFGHNDLLSFDEPATVRLDIVLEEDCQPPTADWQVRWFTYKEDSDSPVELNPENVNGQPGAGTLNLLTSGSIQFTGLSNVAEKEVGGYREYSSAGGWTRISAKKRWIFAELQSALPAGSTSLPRILSATFSVARNRPAKSIERAAWNNRTLDASRDFLPFDRRPELGDCFYFSSSAFSQPGSSITMFVVPAELGATADGIQLRYEFWDGEQWSLLGDSTNANTGANGPYQLMDGSNAFTAGSAQTPAMITFQCPDIVKTRVSGQQGYWIRARLAQGDYGREATYDGENYSPATFQPPRIASMKVEAESGFESNVGLPQSVITENGFFFDDITDANNMGSGGTGNAFLPFQRDPDNQPSFYLAFENDIANRPINMLFSVPGGSVNAYQLLDPENLPVLIWEGWGKDGWEPLTTKDKTERFTRREKIRVIGNGKAAKRPLFGINAYWIRVRLLQGIFRIEPEIDRIYMNAVEAFHRTTIKDEILGSSNGEPGQTFKLAKIPVLEGQQILIEEPHIGTADIVSISAEEGEDAVQETLDESGKPLSVRVRWHEVSGFELSQPSSRHYTIDRASGLISFGDGQRGMIPPQGVKNIIAGQYATGGGARGNVSAGALNKLRKSIARIKSVTNPFNAVGGVDIETLPGVRARGPGTIKSRNRAVTAKDFESLVAQSTGEIARVLCLPTSDGSYNFHPGYVTIIIVPVSDASVSRPSPSAELITYVEDYLKQRGPTEIVHSDPRQVNVIGPSYIGVAVETIVHSLASADAQKVKDSVDERLRRYFHAHLGGQEGKGWPFGRNVYLSEVYAILEELDGVDYVESVKLKSGRQITRIVPYTAFFLPTRYPAGSSTVVEGKRIIAGEGGVEEISTKVVSLLAEDLPEDTSVIEFVGIGFQENEKVTLVSDLDDGVSESSFIESIESGVLRLKQPIRNSYQAGRARVVSQNGNIEATIMQSINAGTDDPEVQEVRIPEHAAGDKFEIIHRNSDISRKAGVIKSATHYDAKVYLDANYLTYSGAHSVTIV